MQLLLVVGDEVPVCAMKLEYKMYSVVTVVTDPALSSITLNFPCCFCF